MWLDQSRTLKFPRTFHFPHDGRELIPKRLRQRVKSLTRYPLTMRIVADPTSFVRFRRVENSTRQWPHDIGAVPIRVRALDGESVLIRPGTADNLALVGTFAGRYHLPPGGRMAAPKVIWDLGANIGLTMADLAHEYPDALVIGVEMDGQNAALADQNVSPWSDRGEVIQSAVWIEDGRVDYVRREGHEQAFHIGDDGSRSHRATTSALTLNRLLEHTPSDHVDYAKVDIEGAEKQVLRSNTDWASYVKSIKVEVHSPYTVGECADDLRALGFSTHRDTSHPALVVGVR